MATNPELFPQENVPTPPKGVQVAGIGSIVREVGKQKPNLERAAIDPDAAIQTYKGRVLIREATPEQMAVFEATLPRLDGKPGETKLKYFQLNLDQMNEVLGGDLTGFQSKIVQLNANVIEEAKRGKMSLDTIKDGADRLGLTEIAIGLMNRKKGESLKNAEEMYRALVLQTSTLMSARHAYQDLMEQGTEEAAANFLKALTLQGAITTSLVGAKTETARMMAVMSNLNRVAEANMGPTMDQIGGVFGDIPIAELQSPKRLVEAMGGVREIQIRGAHYMALEPHQQAMVNRSAWRWVGKGMDAFIESFLMGILSSTVTHAVNVASTAINMMYQIPVNLTSVAVGAARGNVDRMTLDEALIGPIAWMHSWRDAMQAAGKAYKTEEGGSLGSKLDYNRKAISAEAFELNPHDWKGKVVDMLGRFIRIPGRFLVMEDEFFKVFAHREELYRQAIMRGTQVKRAGGSEADVRRTVSETILNPDKAASEAAEDYGRYVTFQTPVEGKLMGPLSDAFSHPILKIFVPFFSTPTNVMKQVGANSPIAAIMPSFYRSLKAGGKEADLAMSRMMTGSTIMGMMALASSGFFGDDVLFTGYGPTDPKAREAWLGKGFQPYSVAKKQKNGQYKSTTYSRFDPVSGILAMAADASWHMRHSDGDTSTIAFAAAAGMYQYMKQLPMLEGAFDIAKLFQGGGYADPEDFGSRFVAQMTKQVTRAATVAVPGILGPLSPTGSLAATVERYFDPTKRSAQFTEGIPDGLRHHPHFGTAFRNFYSELARARSKMPIYSKGVLPDTDRWNIPKQEANGQIYEIVSPIKIRDTRFNDVEDELISLNLGLTKPARQFNGVELSAEERYRYKELANTIVNKKGRNLLGQLSFAIKEYKEKEAAGEIYTPGNKIKILQNIDDKYFGLAKKQMLLEFPDLQTKINERRGIN